VDVGAATYICLTVFDGEARLAWCACISAICVARKAAAPQPVARGPALGLDFERDLNKNLAALFGRA
jgi:hypothetical protein